MPPLECIADFPEKLSFLFQPARYKIAYGGRGGSKSWGYARALLLMSLQRKLLILCARDVQKSIKDSVYRLLEMQAEALGVKRFFDFQRTTILSVNGSEFIFEGLRINVGSVQSKEAVDICWVEEAQYVSDDAFEKLIPTLRKDGSELWASFNPDLETDPVYQRFVARSPPNAVVVKIGWEDNPWFPEVLRQEKDYLYANDAEAAGHVWGGGLRKNSQASVLRGRYVVESFEPEDSWDGPYFGIDWGFGVSPTAAVKTWIHERTLYVEHEAYGVGVDVDDTPALFDATLPGARKYVMRADAARPETISYMRRHGYPLVIAAHKAPGSVDDGVEHLRSYQKIVIHPRCKHTAQDARLWQFETDARSHDVLPILKDGNDDCWDAARYALEPIIRAGRPTPPQEPPPPKRRDYGMHETPTRSWKTV